MNRNDQCCLCGRKGHQSYQCPIGHELAKLGMLGLKESRAAATSPGGHGSLPPNDDAKAARG